MKTTVGKLKGLIREAIGEEPSLSREEAIKWLADWALGEIGFKKPDGAIKYATKIVDEKRGESFRILNVPFVKDGKLLATSSDAFDPYGDGWTNIEALFE